MTATVTDRAGRFVSGLTERDFVVYEDDRQVEITHFSAERVPVSLGIVLDTSGSMAGQRSRPQRGRAVGVLWSTCSVPKTSSFSIVSTPRPTWWRDGRPIATE